MTGKNGWNWTSSRLKLMRVIQDSFSKSAKDVEKSEISLPKVAPPTQLGHLPWQEKAENLRAYRLQVD